MARRIEERRARERTPVLCLLSAVLAAGAVGAEARQAPTDPLALFAPCVNLSRGDRERIETPGRSLVRTLPADGGGVILLGVQRTEADGDRLAAWIREIAKFRSGRQVAAVGRFSDPPRPSDVAGLSLDDEDLDAIRRCRPGHCEVKLTAAEMQALQRAIEPGGADWKPRLQDAFRDVVVRRIRDDMAAGPRALSAYDDGKSPQPAGEVFASMLDRSACITDDIPGLASYLSEPHRASGAPFESFYYWSKDRLGAKPLVSGTHITIARLPGHPAGTLVVGRQVFATHYVNGSLNVTALVGDRSGSRFVVVLNRSTVDVIGGVFGGLTRVVLQRRLRSGLSELLPALVRRLERGLPEAAAP